MSFSDYIENSVLDLMFGGTAFTPSGILYVALCSGSPSENMQTLLEPLTGGYTRAAITNDKSNWSGAINTVSSGTIHNLVDIEFPRANAFVGLVTHFAIMDNLTGGKMYGYGSLANSRTIFSGDTPNFASGTMTITMD